MNNNQDQINTGAVDLFAPANRFASASKMFARLHRWWLLLRKYWWLPALIFAGVLGPVSALTVLSGPTYESKARMWVPGKISVSENWSYTEELVNFLGTQVALLQSPAIQNRALNRMRSASKSAPDPATGSPAPAPVPFHVKVLEGAKSSTLELRVTGKDPAATQSFLNCLMEEYLGFKRESRGQASALAASSLDAEAAQLKSELTEVQNKLQAFQASNNVVLLQQQGNGAGNYLAALTRQLAILRTEQRLLDSLKPEQWMQTDVGQSFGDGGVTRQQLASLAEAQTVLFQADQQMQLLVAKRDELARFLFPAHPKMIKLDQDIAAQRQIVQVAQAQAAKQLALRRQALEAQIRNLELTAKEWDAKAIETGHQVAAYEQLQQSAQRLQAAYDKSLGLIQNLDVANRMEQENVGILDPASAAKPTHRLPLNLAAATVLALALSFGLLFGLAVFQDDFASRAELAQQFAEPVLAQIPAIPSAVSEWPLGSEGLDQQRFEFMEAFRNLRAGLLFRNNGGTRPKTIVITSSLPGEGKSTVALYLAATLAKGNTRVLLVDGDMRRPNLHRYFGLPGGPGLAELLDGGRSSVQVTFPAGVKNLALLPAGIAKRNPGDLMLSPVWESFLAAVKPQFDFILVDTPPMAATDDAATLAPKVDGVLFVVRALATSARVAQGALDAMRQRQTHVLGLIFNRAVSSPCERQYYQPYARDYAWRLGTLDADQAGIETTDEDGIAGHPRSKPASEVNIG